MVAENNSGLLKLVPAENMHLKNIATGDMYAGFIYPAKSLTPDDFEEVTKEQYAQYLLEQKLITEQEIAEV